MTDISIPSGSKIEIRERRFKRLANIVATVVCVLIVIFFGFVISNSMTIKDEVNKIKEGPYPVSVAAGHIETNLIRLETLIEQLTATQLLIDGDYKEEYRNLFRSTLNATQEQIDIIAQSRLNTPANLEKLQASFDLLATRLSVFTVMCWNDSADRATYDEIIQYRDSYLFPLLNEILQLNEGAIDGTEDEIDRMNQIVDSTLTYMFAMTIAILVIVVIMIIVYMVTLNLKNRFELELRESLHAALQETRNANQAKSSFLSNMSHDIRTPMNAIVGNTIIADENIDDKLRVKQCLTRISTSSQHLLSLINDVLDMNKIESGKVTLAQEPFSLKALEDEIAMLVSSQPNSKKLDCTFEMIDVKDDAVVGDTMRLKQILLNLTSNALKYSNEGDRMLFSIAEGPQQVPETANITFTVQDTGIGMKSDFVKRIFEPFEREQNDFTIFTEGTGLGMAITKNLVELMGGTIDVDSELGIGTTVTINLNLKIANERERARLHAAQTGVLRKVTSKQSVSGRVLIVEDNEINMEIAMALISARGAEVDGAMDGLDAISKVTNAPADEYDLIFMDWQMPHMDGIECTKALRKYYADHGFPQVPIVAMTANAFDSDREAALEAGMNDFLAKPINIHQLEEILAKFLGEDAEADADAGVPDEDTSA